MAVESMATNNRDYWAERALTRENEAYLRGANLSGKMFREYEAAAKSIRRQIDSFYSKYAGKYGLTYDQAVRFSTGRSSRNGRPPWATMSPPSKPPPTPA